MPALWPALYLRAGDSSSRLRTTRQSGSAATTGSYATGRAFLDLSRLTTSIRRPGSATRASRRSRGFPGRSIVVALLAELHRATPVAASVSSSVGLDLPGRHHL